MKKQLSKIILCILILCGLSSCSQFHITEKSGFFAWMDSYIAMAENSQDTISLTFFYSKSNVPFQPSDISALSFEGLENTIDIISFTIENNDYNMPSGVGAYHLLLDIQTNETGLFETQYILLQSDKDALRYPVGTCIFDIDIPEPTMEILNLWESAAASSANETFTFSYKDMTPGAKILKIQAGKDIFLEDPKGVVLDGEIDISGEDTAPVQYIKSKLYVELDGVTYILYGKGCYCGAINSSDQSQYNLLELSQQYYSEFS